MHHSPIRHIADKLHTNTPDSKNWFVPTSASQVEPGEVVLDRLTSTQASHFPPTFIPGSIDEETLSTGLRFI